MTLTRKLGLLMALVAAGAVSVAAQDGWRLSATDLRRAYFLGQRNGDQRLGDFLGAYRQGLPVANGGVQVTWIEFSTPYHQVVSRSRSTLSYSSQRAQRDYRANPDQVVVTANVTLPPQFVYAASGPRIWDEFDLRLVQDGRTILPHAVTAEPVYSFGPASDSTLIGFLLRAEFTTQQMARGPVRVEVITNEGQVVGAQFDLSRLK